jgi:histidine triad (HIT) family protein
MLVAPKIAKLQGFAEYGYKVQINCNSGGGQEIFHLHLHLISSYSK